MRFSNDEGQRSRQAGHDARRISMLDCQLQECLSRLEATQRDLEIIRAGLTHVLRRNLPAAERLAERLERRNSFSRASRGSSAQASDELRRTEQLLAQLLLLVDIDRRRMTLRPVDLTALASTAVERLRSREPQRSVNVQIASDILVEADGYLVGILLAALIGDAWRRVRQRPQAGIHLGWTAMGSDTVCFVRDNGEGFDPAEAERLIGPGRSTGRGSRGLGDLGLILARRIVERHRGRLWVDACPEIGATVYFTVTPANAATRGPVCATVV